MFWNNEKKVEEQKQKQIQRELQMEDDVFHRTIQALERLESLLCNEKGKKKLPITAVGDKRDYHNDQTTPREREAYFDEMTEQCIALTFTSHYKEKDFFEMAVQMFMRNLLEWYAGRSLLDYYDEVDACVIPIIVAISHQSTDIKSIFEEYVYAGKCLSNATLDEKYEAISDGLKAWIKAQHIVEETNQKNESIPDSMVTSHYRGEAIDGYKRVVTSLLVLFDKSAPAKKVYRIISEYLPDVVKQSPNINEDAIDAYYNTEKTKTIDDIPFSEIISPIKENNEDNKTILREKIELLYPRLKEAVKAILDEEKIVYHDIKITIN